MAMSRIHLRMHGPSSNSWMRTVEAALRLRTAELRRAPQLELGGAGYLWQIVKSYLGAPDQNVVGDLHFLWDFTVRSLMVYYKS